MHIGIVRDVFTPGNVIYNGYWRSYDKVLSFDERKNGAWTVTVQECSSDGVLVEGSDPRTKKH